ncbi:hypothetical protein DYB37_010566 [Aphanomyces astaci]|uniref:subtilisin n=1 Tax=Aphanomyces astaci TaxID=112090 RepID=A0A418FGH1_APHAT|nr:hypothetical protein DYB37_010566 [Aphanomyces astaci]
MVGTKGIGVAPKAKWIACKGCNGNSDCDELKVVQCAQFLLCPHNNDGKKCDPSKAPHVINGSFGHHTKDFYLEDMITNFIWTRGSSLAAPHVSGAIALYLSANNAASYDQVYRALTENADTDTLTPPNKTCGGIPNTQYPNNLFGHGRLNIFTLEDNTHYVGGDLASFNLTTVESCCAECKKTPRCKAFVWYTLNGGLCWLKDNQGRKVDVDGAKAGVLPAPASGRRP